MLWNNLTKCPPSQILKIHIPIDSSSPTDNISAKIFIGSRSVRALERLKVLRKFFFRKNVVYKLQLSDKFFSRKMVFFQNTWFINHISYLKIYNFLHIYNFKKYGLLTTILSLKKVYTWLMNHILAH